MLLSQMRRTGLENYHDVQRTVANVFKTATSASKPLPSPSVKIEPLNLPPSPQTSRQFHIDGGNGVHPRSSLEFIQVVLGDSPAICVGDKPSNTTTMPISALHEGMVRNATIMVPNPMSGVMGVNKAGAQSSRCESLIIERRYQIIEYDGLDYTDQILRIQHLRSFGVPLIATVFSGGESLHSWFLVRGLSPARQAAFFDYAVHATGADPAHRSPVQMTRLPFATRPDNRELQSLVFFNTPPLL